MNEEPLRPQAVATFQGWVISFICGCVLLISFGDSCAELGSTTTQSNRGTSTGTPGLHSLI